MLLLEPEGAGHPATAWVEQFIFEAEALENLFLAIHAHDGFVMAMSVNDGVALELLLRIIWRVFGDEFAQSEGLLTQPLRMRVVRKQIGKFFAENGATTWLQNDHRHP